MSKIIDDNSSLTDIVKSLPEVGNKILKKMNTEI